MYEQRNLLSTSKRNAIVYFMPKKSKPGRPALVAPPGYVTIERAAELLDVSYSTIYKRIHAHGCAVELAFGSGGTFIRRDQLGELKSERRASSDEDRHAVQVRPSLERYRKWERAAGDKPVSTWLGDLADKAVAR